MNENLNALFNPENIAIVGASSNPLKAGYVILQNLISIGYPKKIFPINLKEKEILGIPCFKKLAKIEEKIEMIVLIAPAEMIFSVMEDFDARMKEKNDVKVIVCAAANYGETKTADGMERQNCLMSIAKKYGVRVIGPNCIGVIDNYNKVDTTFVETGVPDQNFGNRTGISVISQSGAIAASLLMWGASKPLPLKFNKFISIGNMIDVNFIDLLKYLEEDETTRVIGIYMEGYGEAKKMLDLMGKIAIKKPIVVLKVGRSEIGAAAANSHTGSLAGSDNVYDAAFKQNGIIRVETIDELLDALNAFDRMPIPQGKDVFILSQAGGPGIYCTDEVSKYKKMNMSLVSDKTKKALADELPNMAVICAPEGYADITAAANAKQHANSLKIVMEDENVNAVLFITVVPTFLSKMELARELTKVYKEKIRNVPVFFIIMAGEYVKGIRQELEKNDICTFDSPEKAVKILNHMMTYVKYTNKKKKGN